MAKVREILKRKAQYTDPLSASVEDIFSDIQNSIENKDEVEVIEKDGKKLLSLMIRFFHVNREVL